MAHELVERPADDVDVDPDDVALPVAPLVALAGSGTFAVWMSLTCFVC